MRIVHAKISAASFEIEMNGVNTTDTSCLVFFPLLFLIRIAFSIVHRLDGWSETGNFLSIMLFGSNSGLGCIRPGRKF